MNGKEGINSGWVLDNRGGTPRTSATAVYGALFDIDENAVKIGRYDENNLFEIKDYKKHIKEQIKDFGGLLSFICFILPAALGLMYVITTKNHSTIQQTEKVVTIAKDSLQTLKQDTFQITKDSLKMFK